MRYGAIRDLVLCATVVAGRRPNCAGRATGDQERGRLRPRKALHRFARHLGLLTDITLKVTAQPRAARARSIVPVDDPRHGLMWARQLYPISLVASAIILGRSDSMLRFTRKMLGSDEGSDSRDFQGIQEIQDTLEEYPYVLMYTAEGLVRTCRPRWSEDCVLKAAGASGGAGRNRGRFRYGRRGTFPGDRLWMPAHAVGVPVRDLPAYIQDQAALLTARPFLVERQRLRLLSLWSRS